MRFKKILLVVLALSLLLACAGCGQREERLTYDNIPESTGGKDLEARTGDDDVFSLNMNTSRSFNPLVATNRSNQLIGALVYENMVELDNDFNVIKNVIVDWKSNDDYTFWTFTIDPGHTFHDGTPLTGKDVRYSLDRAVSSDRFRGRFNSYLGASYSDTEVTVTLGIGNSQLPKLLNIPIIKYGTFSDDYPMGSGPYMYNEDYTELHAYEGYIGRPVEVQPTDEDGNVD
ncbi:MAG: hypothetical protein J6J62_02805, partial [Oscillospiraceae bacterium]|nr:hypothetical protein [Oscillospiraceae bacterium]